MSELLTATKHVKEQGGMAPSRRRQRAITSGQARDIHIWHKSLGYLQMVQDMCICI